MEEIVRRLRKANSKTVALLKEGMSKYRLTEADEDEEESNPFDLDIPDSDEEETDSQEEFAPEDSGEEEERGDNENSPSPPASHSSSPSIGSVEDDEEGDAEVTEPEDEDALGKDTEKANVNPLDNDYAVNYKMGDEVVLSYSDGTNSKLKGTVDGYDAEGFYRIKWASGLTTSGITDIALNDLVSHNTNECICGSSHFVNEGNYVVCDTCGRRIRENIDQLTKLDKSRPKGKRMIRSEAHPISTAVKPSIGESIRRALSAPLREDEDYEEDYSVFDTLKDELDNQFWTRKDELVSDIESLGFIVDEIDDEYVIISHEDDEENVMQVPIGGTSRTMNLDFRRSRML